jgi:hypothetical protein
LKERNPSEELNVDGRIILKLMLRKRNERMQIGKCGSG